MNENNKGNSENTNNPNSNSKNNKRYKYRNRRKKLADSISENSQNSTHEFSNNEKINTKKNSTNTQPLEGENVEKPSEKKKKEIAIFLQNSQVMKIGKSRLLSV